jgi:ABC-type nickel/cobalt efflux system permease component RcnA
MKKLLLASLVGSFCLLAQPLAALAHPLGNFTVNRYSRIELSAERLRIRYVLDMAEIPTFQAMPLLDANGDGRVSDAERGAFAARTLAQVTRHLHLAVDGVNVPLRAGPSEVDLVSGQAGLPTLRLSAWLDAPAAAQTLARLGAAGQVALRIDYRDENDPERIGWREIVVKTDGLSVASAAITGGGFSTTDVSDELRRYPDEMLANPVDLRQVNLSVSAGATAAGAAQQTALPAPGTRSLARAADGFTELLSQASSATLTPGLVATALLMAFALGAMHALSPGHGKTIVGAYLIGARGTPRHALFLGTVVTAVHTSGVFALGLATLYASAYVLPERIYPWMSLASGLLVLVLGLSLARSRWRSAASVAHSHHHSPATTPGASLTHSHGLGSHTHTVPGADGAPLSWRSLLALGISGGLLPCPSALVVMLGAIALHRVAFGLVLIIAFSMGLAGTLVAIGLLMVYSSRAAGRYGLAARLGLTQSATLRRLARLVPVASAGVVTVAGVALVAQSIRQIDPALGAGSAAWPVFRLSAVALLATALTLGLRHGIDWDHLAAIADITGAAGTSSAAERRPVVWLALLYALGHGLVVIILGVAALAFGAVLPDWVDPLMERVVGVTLVALGVAVIVSLIRYWRGGDLRLQSRWMLLFAAVRGTWRRFQSWAHGHSHDGSAHVHRVDQYGPRAAFGVGLIHGIGAETGTQVLIIAAVGGAASQGLGLWMLLAFVFGLLLSNTGVAVLAASGFARSSRARPLYVASGCVAAAFSLVVGAYFILGAGDSLPDLQIALAFGAV